MSDIPYLIARLREAESESTKGPFVARVYDVNEPDEGDERTNPNVVLHASLSLGDGRCAIFGSWHKEAKSAAMKLNLFPHLLKLVEVQKELIGWHQMMPDSDSPDHDKWVSRANELASKVASATAELVKAWEGCKP